MNLLAFAWTYPLFLFIVYLMRKILLLLFLLVSVCLSAKQHTTVIVSLDGYRWDYPLMYNTPFLDSLGNRGVSAEMCPSFPSKTFPNHYTMATGLVPDHHGIIANRFYDISSGRTYSIGDTATSKDGSFYGGEPIWLTARRQGIRTGVVYWPGSDVAILGQYPDYYKDYAQKPLLTFPQRLDEVERLLTLPDSLRPQLVMMYFDEPDHSGHLYTKERNPFFLRRKMMWWTPSAPAILSQRLSSYLSIKVCRSPKPMNGRSQFLPSSAPSTAVCRIMGL